MMGFDIKIVSKYFFIYIFSSLFKFSYKNSSRNFDENFPHLGFGSVSNSGSVSCSNSGSSFGSKFFIRSNLFLNLLRTFSLTVKNKSILLRNNFF